MLKLSGLWKTFRQHVAVRDMSMLVGEGDIVALLGPSGSGKTTTLRMIAGFASPDRGTVSVAGRDITKLRPYERDIGVVFQDYALFPHLTIADNIGYGLRRRGLSRAEQAKRVARYIDLVRLSGFEQRMPLSLSGGQQQRVALARALAIEPGLLLLDEPLSALDAKLRVEIRGELRDILVAAGCATVIVTHDQEEAMSLADRIYVMNEGSVVQTGTPAEIYERPVDGFVAGFVGRSNVFSGRLTRNNGVVHFLGEDGIEFSWPAPDAPTEAASFAIRPERLRLKDATAGSGTTGAAAFAGTLVRRMFLGQDEEISVELPSGRRVVVLARRGEFPGLSAGAAVRVEFDVEDVVRLLATARRSEELSS